MTSTTTTAPANDLRESRKEQAPAKKIAKPATAKATKAVAAKPAPAKPVAEAKPAEAEKRTYSATARCGRVNTRVSATVLTHALDVVIAGRKGPQYTSGVIVAMYSSLDKATKAADEINAGSVPDWTNAIVVPVTLVKDAAA